MKMRMAWAAGVAALLMIPAAAMARPALAASDPAAPDSKRMERAKDFIADEHWARAIVELQAVADDPREPNRDEALFWLAQSQYETGDHPAAIQTIARLERQYPNSRWVRLGRSLRVEIAQRLNRADVLWAVVAPQVPPTPAVPPAPAPPAPAASTPPPSALRPFAGRPPASPSAVPAPSAVAPVPSPAAPAPPAMPAPAMFPMAPPPPTPRPPSPPRAAALLPGGEYFLPMPYPPDTDLKIEAMFGLIDGHGDRVIPLLREIALDPNNPDEARRAVFALARSNRPEARTTVIEVARVGAEPVRIAAIREMGRFQGAGVNTELMKVYSIAGTPRVKRQIVSSLGERADNVSLLHIVKAESDAAVRDTAIVTLGRLPDARPLLRTLYTQTRPESRMAVLSALLASKDEDELIRIARVEKDPMLRQRARMHLQMLGTPKALTFLHENP